MHQVRTKVMIQKKLLWGIEQVLDNIPKDHMKILFGDFNTKVGRENIFKLTIRNESVYHDSNDNGVRIVHFAT
jgi:hypothetical protein